MDFPSLLGTNEATLFLIRFAYILYQIKNIILNLWIHLLKYIT